MRLVGENAFKQSCCMWANGLRPIDHARRRPFQMGPTAVLVYRDRMPITACARVQRHPLALVEDLDRGRVRAHFHQLMHQVVRNAVVLGVEDDVAVNVHPSARPLAEIEWFSSATMRKPAKKLKQCRLQSKPAFQSRRLINPMTSSKEYAKTQ